MGEFRMPSLGADMDRGTVLEWRVGPGDAVHRGDVVAVVDTDKSDIEVEVFEDGVVEEILVPVGTEVAVGTPLARLTGTAAELPHAPVAERPPVTEPHPVAEPQPEAVPAAVVASPVIRRLAGRLGVDLRQVTGTGSGGRLRRADVERAAGRRPGHVPSSPYARRLAARRSVDLAAVIGTGPGGAVRAADVERAPHQPVAPPSGPVTSLPRQVSVPPGAPTTAPAGPRAEAADRRPAMRRAIANLLARSQREIPHYYLNTTIDFAAARDWLADTNAARPPAQRLLPAALLLKATAVAAREVPGLNGFWIDDAFRPAEAVHLGVAINLRGGGLVAPAIHDCDRLGLDELMARLRDLVARARTGVLRSSEMSDPTITVTNLGDQGADAVYGVIYPPQVALVGFGRIVERPWAAGGMLGVRPIVTATLAADHRASDGHLGGLLLAAIDRRLQKPEAL